MTRNNAEQAASGPRAEPLVVLLGLATLRSRRLGRSVVAHRLVEWRQFDVRWKLWADRLLRPLLPPLEYWVFPGFERARYLGGEDADQEDQVNRLKDERTLGRCREDVVRDLDGRYERNGNGPVEAREPGEVGQLVEVPRVELVVERAREDDADEVRREESRHDVVRRHDEDPRVDVRVLQVGIVLAELGDCGADPSRALAPLRDEGKHPHHGAAEQHHGEGLRDEHLLGKELEVHGPLEHEHTAKVEGTLEVLHREGREERVGQRQLHRRADREANEGLEERVVLE
mmetsp:Transcript_79357/g.226673  ORF Transcript_79357/g.226673 Transcript_79357/m.226673 type:complete len:287 (+) Transcript_79357:84-944(+)